MVRSLSALTASATSEAGCRKAAWQDEASWDTLLSLQLRSNLTSQRVLTCSPAFSPLVYIARQTFFSFWNRKTGYQLVKIHMLHWKMNHLENTERSVASAVRPEFALPLPKVQVCLHSPFLPASVDRVCHPFLCINVNHFMALYLHVQRGWSFFQCTLTQCLYLCKSSEFEVLEV